MLGSGDTTTNITEFLTTQSFQHKREQRISKETVKKLFKCSEGIIQMVMPQNFLKKDLLWMGQRYSL